MNRTTFVWSLATLLSAVAATSVSAEPADDKQAIRTAALDYIEGWYTADAARMARAVHPELAKRLVSTDPATQRSNLTQMGAMTLVGSTGAGGGRDIPKERQSKDVVILDVFQNSASVRINAATWVDYLQLAKWNGEWKIVNVLYEIKRPSSPQ